MNRIRIVKLPFTAREANWHAGIVRFSPGDRLFVLRDYEGRENVIFGLIEPVSTAASPCLEDYSVSAGVFTQSTVPEAEQGEGRRPDESQFNPPAIGPVFLPR